MKRLRIIFAGTPRFAQCHLQAITESQHQIIAVYTQPDRPSGRGRKLNPSPVKEFATKHEIPVYQPASLRIIEERQQLAELNPDIIVVVAYGLILPQEVLDIPPFGCINVHASALPRWRGAAPIQRAIEAGDKETGITVMKMDAGLDTGNILLDVPCPIEPDDTSADLHDRLVELGRPALVKVLDSIARDSQKSKNQNNDLASYAHKITKAEARIDWNKSAYSLNCMIRAFNPWPIATACIDGSHIRIWEAKALQEQTHHPPGTLINTSRLGIDVACKKGVLRITKLQLPGNKAMPAHDLLNSQSTLFCKGKQFL